MVATYNYIDESGSLLYQKIRYEPRHFELRRPDGNGGWIWKLGDVRRVVYRLPEAVETISLDRPIAIVEGEKDVDNCRRIGIPATCNYEGAGKWNDQQTRTFAGADVYIVAHNDEPGHNHPHTKPPPRLRATDRNPNHHARHCQGDEAAHHNRPPRAGGSNRTRAGRAYQNPDRRRQEKKGGADLWKIDDEWRGWPAARSA